MRNGYGKVHACGGNRLHEEEGTHVYLVHEGKNGSGIGCGALGHFNPEKAQETLNELWAELQKLGLHPDVFFGRSLREVFLEVQAMEIPSNAGEHCRRLLERAEKKGIPTMVGIYSHEDGLIRFVGAVCLEKAAEPVHYSICSDARVSEEAAHLFFLAVKDGLKAGNVFEAPHLVAPNAHRQAPLRILIHSPEERPKKTKGETFNVTVEGEPDFHELLSIAYALVNFGPCGSGSLKKIEFTQKPTFEAFKNRLAGLSGMQLTLTSSITYR